MHEISIFFTKWVFFYKKKIDSFSTILCFWDRYMSIIHFIYAFPEGIF